jgi:hypothetical protein
MPGDTSKINYESYLKTVRIMLAAKSDPNTVTGRSNNSPLHSSVTNNNPDAVALLTAAKADPNTQNKKGNTPLYLAATTPELRMESGVLTQLITAKADPNLANNNGNSPLHAAAGCSNENFIQLLLNAKANPDAKNNLEKTPKNIAQNSGIHNKASEDAKDRYTRIVELLTQASDSQECDGGISVDGGGGGGGAKEPNPEVIAKSLKTGQKRGSSSLETTEDLEAPERKR